jgi:hypothetical protein
VIGEEPLVSDGETSPEELADQRRDSDIPSTPAADGDPEFYSMAVS